MNAGKVPMYCTRGTPPPPPPAPRARAGPPPPPPPLRGVGALHRLADAARVVGLLHQAVGLHAPPPAAGMLAADVVVRLDAQRDAVLDLDFHQVRARDALIAKHRDLALLAHEPMINERRLCQYNRLPPFLTSRK